MARAHERVAHIPAAELHLFPGAGYLVQTDVAVLGLPLDVPTGTAPGGAIAIGGCPGWVGCYNAVHTGAQLGAGDPTAVLLGTSYLYVATVTRYGTVARTVLSYSQSTDPTSPHFADQTAVFARAGLLDERMR